MSVAEPVRIVDKARTSHQLVWLNAGLALLILASTFAVIHTTHACRALYAQLQEVESVQWYLQEDYGRLMLEHSTWASHHRVEKVAEEELGMQAPGLAQLRMISR